MTATAASGSAASGSSSRIERAAVQQLPPGPVTLAHVRTPQGSDEIGLRRTRYLGKAALCINVATQAGVPGGGAKTCANYPIGPQSGAGIGDAPIWRGPTYGGKCIPREFLLVTGVVLRRGLSAWVRAADGVSRMRAVAIPKAFDVTGPLVYAVVVTGGPVEIVPRSASGKTVFTSPNGAFVCHF